MNIEIYEPIDERGHDTEFTYDHILQFKRIGIIDNYDSFHFTLNLIDVGEFEIAGVFNDKVSELLKPNYLIKFPTCGNPQDQSEFQWGIIHSINIEFDEDSGYYKYTCYGSDPKYLMYKQLLGIGANNTMTYTYTFNGKFSLGFYDCLAKCGSWHSATSGANYLYIVNDTSRLTIPTCFDVLSTSDNVTEQNIDFQLNTTYDMLDWSQDYIEKQGYVTIDDEPRVLGFQCIPNTYESTIDGEVHINENFTPVLIKGGVYGAAKSTYPILSLKWGNVTQLDYTNSFKERTDRVMVAGEGEGPDRARTIVIDQRSEIGRKWTDRINTVFMDARDLQKKYKGQDGEEHTYTDDEYQDLLVTRGKQELYAKNMRTLDCTIDTTGFLEDSRNRFGLLGKVYRIQDPILNLDTTEAVSSVELFDDAADGQTWLLTLGNDLLTTRIQ